MGLTDCDCEKLPRDEKYSAEALPMAAAFMPCELLFLLWLTPSSRSALPMLPFCRLRLRAAARLRLRAHRGHGGGSEWGPAQGAREGKEGGGTPKGRG